jgi:hypothetical protein
MKTTLNKNTKIRILTLTLIVLFIVGTLCTAQALNFPKSSKVAMVPSNTCSSGGGLYVGSSWPNGDSFTFTNLAPSTIADGNIANPITAGGFDTVVLMATNFNFASYWTDTDFNTRITDFVYNGGKLIIYTSETNSATEFSAFIYPFAVDTPGATGSRSGTLTNLVDDTLSSSEPTDATYVDLAKITSDTDAVGDLTVMTSYDAHWYIDLFGINVNHVGGPAHTYAFYGSGIIIFNGLDVDYTGNSYPPSNANGRSALSMLWYNELRAQTLGPSQNVNGLTLTPATATNDVGTSHTVTATVKNTQNNDPIPNILVTFTITSGPNMGTTGTATTDANGQATFTWSSSSAGTDTIQGSIPNSNANGPAITSTAEKTWVVPRASTQKASVWTTDMNDNPQNVFAAGDQVKVWYIVQDITGGSVTPGTATMYLASGDNVDTAVALGAPYEWTITGTGSMVITAPAPGAYLFIIDGQTVATIASNTLFILPESIFGTLAALGAGLAAFGLIKLKIKKPVIKF